MRREHFTGTIFANRPPESDRKGAPLITSSSSHATVPALPIPAAKSSCPRCLLPGRFRLRRFQSSSSVRGYLVGVAGGTIWSSVAAASSRRRGGCGSKRALLQDLVFVPSEKVAPPPLDLGALPTEDFFDGLRETGEAMGRLSGM